MRILCYGDSNTYGYDPRGFFGDRYPKESRWVDILAQRTGWQIQNAIGRNINKYCRFLNEKLKKFEGKTPKKQLDQKCGCKNPDKGFLRPKINFIFHRKKDPTQGGRLTSLVLAGILSIATEDAEM